MWLKKRRERSAEEAPRCGPASRVFASCRRRGWAACPTTRLSIPLGEGGKALHINRHEIWVSDGLQGGAVAGRCAQAAVPREPTASLRRGNGALSPEYVMFFYGIEHNVLLFCELTRQPIDAEFIEIYAQMRRRPDGKSLGPLHDVIWQSAAVALGYGLGVRRNTRRYLASYPARRGISKSAPHRVTTSVITADDREQVSTRHPLPLGRDKARCLAVRFLIRRVAKRDGVEAL